MDRDEIRTKEAAMRYLDESACFEAIEGRLREETAGNKPCAVFIDRDHAPDPAELQRLCAWLDQRGWIVAVDDAGEVWVHRRPLGDPGEVKRNLN